MIKSYGAAASYTGVTARDDIIRVVNPNEEIIIKSVSITLYGGAIGDAVEGWFGISYTGAQTFAVAVCHKAETTVTVCLYPNVKVLPGERISFSIAMTAAASGCNYSITYDVITTDSYAPATVAEIAECNLLSRLLGTCDNEVLNVTY